MDNGSILKLSDNQKDILSAELDPIYTDFS
jgi:hypothetical protein